MTTYLCLLFISQQHKFTKIVTRFQEEFAYIEGEEHDSSEN
jgi:hypothetical protein